MPDSPRRALLPVAFLLAFAFADRSPAQVVVAPSSRVALSGVGETQNV